MSSTPQTLHEITCSPPGSEPDLRDPGTWVRDSNSSGSQVPTNLAPVFADHSLGSFSKTNNLNLSSRSATTRRTPSPCQPPLPVAFHLSRRRVYGSRGPESGPWWKGRLKTVQVWGKGFGTPGVGSVFPGIWGQGGGVCDPSRSRLGVLGSEVTNPLLSEVMIRELHKSGLDVIQESGV